MDESAANKRLPFLRCVVVTPEATVFDAACEFVTLPLVDGEYGIAKNHAPMIGRMGYGELRIRTPDGTRKFYADGGFAQVADNLVSVLTSRAVPAERLDLGEAEELLQLALVRPAACREELAIRERMVSQARGQLRTAKNSR
jgi:F-type H+-transporting ATPase subunit epsilon